jgi:tetratricopeptide (TPR) repeat protein
MDVRETSVRSGAAIPARLLTSLLVLLALASALPSFALTSAELNTYQRIVQEGFSLLRTGEHRAARDRFEEALRFHDGDAAAYLGLGIASFHLHEDRAAQRALERALELDPRGRWAYRALGDLAYRRDDLEGAAGNWSRALELDPGDRELRARIERIRREHRTEKDFNKDVTSHFSVKYEGRERIEAGRIILRTLEDAYGEVGRELSFYPDREIAVILYSDRQFQEVTDAPGWSGAVFDGKIRVPIGGIERETPGLRALLYHEYTHAVVRAIAPRVPTWLNEGLAQYFEKRTISGQQLAVLRQVHAAGKLPSLRALEGSFMGLNGSQAGYAYLLSLSAVRQMVEDYGMYRVRSVLDALKDGADTPTAISNGLLLSYEDFERNWRRSFE